MKHGIRTLALLLATNTLALLLAMQQAATHPTPSYYRPTIESFLMGREPLDWRNPDECWQMEYTITKPNMRANDERSHAITQLYRGNAHFTANQTELGHWNNDIENTTSWHHDRVAQTASQLGLTVLDIQTEQRDAETRLEQQLNALPQRHAIISRDIELQTLRIETRIRKYNLYDCPPNRDDYVYVLTIVQGSQYIINRRYHMHLDLYHAQSSTKTLPIVPNATSEYMLLGYYIYTFTDPLLNSRNLRNTLLRPLMIAHYNLTQLTDQQMLTQINNMLLWKREDVTTNSNNRDLLAPLAPVPMQPQTAPFAPVPVQSRTNQGAWTPNAQVRPHD